MAKPEPVRRDGFWYDGTTFATAEGVAFERPEALRRICFPADRGQWKAPSRGRGRPRKARDISEAEAEALLDRRFVLAQSKFYGVPVPSSAPSGAAAEEELIARFREMVAAGKVSSIFGGWGV